MIEFLEGLSQTQLLVLILLATVIIIEIMYNVIRAVREKKERKKIYGQIDWLPDPSSMINDEMLNKINYSVAKVDDLHASTIHVEPIRIVGSWTPTRNYTDGDIVCMSGKTYMVSDNKFVEVSNIDG